MDRAFLTKRKEKLGLIIEAFEDAILKLSMEGGVQSYSLDTGQSKQMVTRSDVEKMKEVLDGYVNQYNNYCLRLNGGAVLYGSSCN